MTKLTTAFLLTSLLGLACQYPGYTPPAAGALEKSAWQERVHMTPVVQGRIVVREVREAFQNDLLRVQVDLQNLLQSESSFRTSVEWFDIAGFKLDSPNDGWMSHIAQPLEKFTVTAGAVNPAAASWRLNIDTWAR